MKTLFPLAFILFLQFSQDCSADDYAFLVGVRDYSLKGELRSLRYSEDDVQRLATTLQKAGVPAENIILMTHAAAAEKARFTPTADQIRKEFALLLKELGPDDSIIVGFSGHGLQFDQEETNYFCPMDAVPSDRASLISLARIYNQLELKQARSKLLLVDACRDDPLTDLSKAATRLEVADVADRRPPVLSGGTIAIFSCSASEQSFESDKLSGGVFFHFVNKAFSGEADTNKDRIVDLFELESFTIKEVQKWSRVHFGRSQFPERLGRARGIVELLRLNELEQLFSNSIGMKLRLIPAGTFTMGSPPSEPERRDDEAQHEVTLSRGFYLGQYEVTQGEFEHVMGFNPSYFKGSKKLPVEQVSWFDAVMFCNRLSELEGRISSYRINSIERDGRSIKFASVGLVAGANGYRLPTEAEWEYACRAGTSTAFNLGSDINTRQVNFNGSSTLLSDKKGIYREKTIAVDELTFPNKFGLEQMHGNVNEWCWDAASSSGLIRSLRGGSHKSFAAFCRSARRSATEAARRYNFVGVRVVLGF